MAIVFTCECGRVLQVAEAVPGRKARCPGCGRRLDIPDNGSAAPGTFRLWRIGLALLAGLLVVASTILLVTLLLVHPSTDPLPHVEVAVHDPNLSLPERVGSDGQASSASNRDGAVSLLDKPGSEDSSKERTDDPASSQRLLEPPAENPKPQPAEEPRQERNLVPIEDRQDHRIAEVSKPMPSEPKALEGTNRPFQPQPAPKAEPRLFWQLPLKAVFFQEVQVAQHSAFRTAGLETPMTTAVRYVVVSRLAVEKIEEDGGVVVSQRIESARLLEADDVSRSMLAPAMRDLIGQTYKLTLNANRDVVRLEGKFFTPKVADFGGIGFAQASLIDRDGWKELHQATFFQPNRSVRPGDRWAKETTHSWGALGVWKGRTLYGYVGRQGPLHRFDYRLDLSHEASNGAGSGLPLLQAAFRHQESGGSIWFDTDKGRVSAVEERFHVRGRLIVNLLGQAVPLELEEVQQFRVVIHNQAPARD
ncbi:MAG: hypothetical protein NZM31_11265 [Gemmatales bacterium]|nr:hypothetical protein [Gemmatales bacterium]MDW8387576.1 hypothetical protein [Gemmatales bacterium]